MKSILPLFLAGTVIVLSGCAHEERPDTRAQSFQTADIDHDQKLTYGEYQTYLNLQGDMGDTRAIEVTSDAQKNPEKTILIKFQTQDMNRDTFLTRDELAF